MEAQKNSLVLVVVIFGLQNESQVARPGFVVLDFFENIQGDFFNDHFCIRAIQSIVFGAIQGFWSAVEYSVKDSGYFGFPNVGVGKG